MADIFLQSDAERLVNGKYLLFFGDSNTRALYKDIITLLQRNRLIAEAALRKKLEPSYEGDSLMDSIGLTRGRNFIEHRRFSMRNTVVEFYFVTKCISDDVMKALYEVRRGERRAPDVLVMNSMLWDITRWGSKSVALFKQNLNHLVEEMAVCLPPTTLVIWLTTPPLAKCRGGFLIPQVEFLKHTMRFEAMEANMFAHASFTSHGYDVLDLHYYLMMNVHRRNNDGIHWTSKAVRFMTNLLFTHICQAWGRTLPGNFTSGQLMQLEGLINMPPRKPIQAVRRLVNGKQEKEKHDDQQNAQNSLQPAHPSVSHDHQPKNGEMPDDSKPRSRKARKVYYPPKHQNGSSRRYAPYDRRWYY